MSKDYYEYRSERYKRMYEEQEQQRDRAVELLRNIVDFYDDPERYVEEIGEAVNPARDFLATLGAPTKTETPPDSGVEEDGG